MIILSARTMLEQIYAWPWTEIVMFGGMFIFMTCGAALGWHATGDDEEER